MLLSMVLESPRHLRERITPSRPLAPHEARVRVSRAGVCGTDLAIWSGAYPVPLPIVLGHEWVGCVTEVGNNTDPRASALLGARVVGDINNTCASLNASPPCPACEKGWPHHCLLRTVTGIVAHDGAFSQQLIVPWRNLVPVPQAIADEDAVFIEPLAAALQTFSLSPIQFADTVVILGSGRLGTLVALVARALTPNVIVTTRSPARACLLRQLGLEPFVFDPEFSRQPTANPLDPAPSLLLDEVRARTRGLGADCVVEATGEPDCLALALDLVRPRGTIALKSTPGHALRDFPLTRFVVNEVTLQGSRCGEFSAALDFQTRHRLPLSTFIRGEFSLPRLAEAFEAAAREPGKIIVAIAQQP